MQGLVDVPSIKWMKPRLSKTPTDSVLNYNKDLMIGPDTNRAQKIYADLNRICELEDAVVEWYDQKYYPHKKNIVNFNFLRPFFNIKKVEYSGAGTVIVKAHLIAKNSGYLSEEQVGMEVEIYEEKQAITNEAKRIGLLSDRSNYLQLRVGDILILYIARDPN